MQMSKQAEKLEIQTINIEVIRTKTKLDDDFINSVMMEIKAIEALFGELEKRGLEPQVELNQTDRWVNYFVSGDLKLDSQTNDSMAFSFSLYPRELINQQLAEYLPISEESGIILNDLSTIIRTLEEMAEKKYPKKNERLSAEQNYAEKALAINDRVMLLELISMFLREEFAECIEMIDEYNMQELYTEKKGALVDFIELFIEAVNGNLAFVLESLDIEIEEEDIDFSKKVITLFIIEKAIEFTDSKGGNGIKEVVIDSNTTKRDKFFILLQFCKLAINTEELQDIDYYLKMLKLYLPEDLAYKLMYVSILTEADRNKEAMKLVKTLEEQYPGNSLVEYNKGIVMRNMDKAAEALAIFNALLAEEPEYKNDILSYKADCLIDLGRRSEGQLILENILAEEPDYIEVKFKLGIIYKTEGNLRKSLRYLLDCEKAGLEIQGVYYLIYEIYEQLGLPGKAQLYLLKSGYEE
jgi:tetratricopeptide (TPR) repeat protein